MKLPTLVPSLALLAAALPLQGHAKTLEDYIQPAPRSVDSRVFEVWRNPGRFTKNPDIIQLPSGRLMLVYSDTEAHLSQEDQHLVILISDDLGKTWMKHGEVDTHDMRKGDERLVTPRLSRLQDGRLIVLVDQDDWGHFHEDEPSGILEYWSADNGETWSKPTLTGVKGFEPDRVLELLDGNLVFADHQMRGEDQEFADVLYASADGGKTWSERATIAHDGYHRFCEGAVVLLNGGKELACVLRENHGAGMPSFVTFSQDNGHTWSPAQSLPFSVHRPYAKQLADGRVLVTGRNILGGLGTFAWCGDLHAEAGHYEIGGPTARFTAKLTAEALEIDNKPEEACRYTLLPPESSRSEINYEARLKVDGPPGVPVAFMSINRLYSGRGPILLSIASDGLWISKNLADEKKLFDMTTYRDVAIRLKRGWLEVTIDGKPAFNACIFWESIPMSDFFGNDPEKRTQFGQIGSVGHSSWQRVSYDVQNLTQPPFHWAWRASDRKWPDQYERDRLIQIYANPLTPSHHPDHGYSSWLTLPDNRIFFVDYTNRGDPPNKSHLVGLYLSAEDLKNP